MRSLIEEGLRGGLGHGGTPMAWLREQRLEAARTMLEHSQGMDAAAAVESIAASCGFGRRRRRGAFRLHKQVFFCTVCEIARREGS